MKKASDAPSFADFAPGAGFGLTFPRRQSMERRVLDALRRGERLTASAVFVDIGTKWLPSLIYRLRKKHGWTITKRIVPATKPGGGKTTTAEYYIREVRDNG